MQFSSHPGKEKERHNLKPWLLILFNWSIDFLSDLCIIKKSLLNEFLNCESLFNRLCCKINLHTLLYLRLLLFPYFYTTGITKKSVRYSQEIKNNPQELSRKSFIIFKTLCSVRVLFPSKSYINVTLFVINTNWVLNCLLCFQISARWVSGTINIY